MEVSDLKKDELLGTLEAILFACGDPIGADKLAQALDLSEDAVLEALETLQKKFNTAHSGIHLLRMNTSFQFVTNPDYITPVRAALDLRRNAPLSQAAMEVLAVIAYNEPVTKAFVEQVRGVDCSGVIGSLVQKGLIEERGRLELPGRPLLYGTTEAFLRTLNISALSELPPLPKKEAQAGETEKAGEDA
ncbi:MAG: SMC-Scp complex subunit ScpB [Clostridia bacterium]|nr:SMC-Scp complex subunit ScpB [Clostridia bacterium]